MATRNCADCTQAEVNNAVNGIQTVGHTTWSTPADDLDIVNLPAGSATWTIGVNVTNNIQIIGAGEGQTIITEDLSVRTNASVPLFFVTLSREMQAPNYSFRLSGMTILANQSNTLLPAPRPYIKLISANLRTTTPPPYVGGCVSRVRLDHLTITLPRTAIVIIVDSVLGVGDHITITKGVFGTPLKTYMGRWTPDIIPQTGLPTPTSYIASKAYGGYADESYWGTDKFWFWEDCNVTLPSVTGSTNLCDDDEGGRAVYRHNTITDGSFASHGMEGGLPGVRAREIYNNNIILSKAAAQTRSGTMLYFNNKTSNQTAGLPLQAYRIYLTFNSWGGADGLSRYDINDDAYNATAPTGTITAVSPVGGSAASEITVSGDISSINLTDGKAYIIQDLDDPFTAILPGGAGNDPGWQFKQSGINSIAGQVISIAHDSSAPPSAAWQIGHNYVIRRINAVWGQVGRGVGNLMNGTGVTGNGYFSYTYPATSGTKASTPYKIGQGGSTIYPLDPCYSWNNTDTSHGYVGFEGTNHDHQLVANRDFFNLAERTIETQDVGYPAVSYARATSDWPLIGPNSDVPYEPFTYPHPLTGAAAGKIIALSGNLTFGNVLIGEAPTSTLVVSNSGDTLLTVTSVSYPTAFTGATTGFTVAAGATHDITVTFTPVAETTYTGNITVSSDADSGINTRACSGTGVAPTGGGGHGKGHKKGVLVARGR